MPTSNHQRFRDKDLMLRVSPAMNRAQWDESRYEAFANSL